MKGILSLDLTAAEAVAVAYFADDKRSKEAFANGWDTHRMCYADIFGGAWRDVTKEQRNSIGKVVRHMTNYDGGARALSKKIGCSEQKAELYIANFKKANPHVDTYHETVQLELRRTKGLRNPYGRWYPMLERWDDSFLRSMYAWKPASTVADMMNKTIVDFYNIHGHRWTIMLQLHDAIYVQVEDVENVGDIEELMEAVGKCALQPLEVNGDIMVIKNECELGLNWKDMKEISLIDGVLWMGSEEYKGLESLGGASE